MAHLVKRLAIRSLTIALVWGILLGLELLSPYQHARPARAQVADPSKAAVILNWYAARNHGDDDAAAALFADNAFFVGAALTGFCSVQSPCYDRASELRNLQTVAAATPNLCFTVTDIAVHGNIVTGRLEGRSDTNRRIGIEHTVATFLAEVQDSKIIAFVQRSDSGDPFTALRDAINAGTAQAGAPIPTPNPVCG